MIGFMRKFYELRALMMFIMFFLLSKSSLFAQINLTATAGTATGSYTTISGAFAAINAGTHQGNIIISIDGNTTEPASPVYLGASGVSTALYNSVLIKPSVVATVSGTPNAGAAVINFNGSDNVILDGSITVGGTTRDLTITNTNLNTIANSACIRLVGQTTAGTGLALSNFTIKNTILIGHTPGNNGTSGSTVTTSYGIYAGSNTLTSMLNTATGANYDNLSITNNEIKKAYIGIYVAGGVSPNQNDNLLINQNLIGSSTQSDQVGFKGIFASQTTTGTITENNVFSVKSTTSTSPVGIEIAGTASTAVTVSRNRVEGIYSESLSGYGAYGINLVGGNNHMLVNNVITDVRTINYSSTSTTFNAFGIRITSGTGHKIYYNSVNLFGDYTLSSTFASGATAAAFCVTSTAVTGLDIKNNIFSNKITSSYATKEFHAVWFPTAYNFLNATLNYNYYGIPADGYHFVGKIGLTVGTGNYLSLNNWQAISQVNNATNDVESEPVSNTVVPFTTNLDLTIPAGTITASESAGLEIASLGVPNIDFTGATRPGTGGTAPDMGAYENATLPITCPQPTTISVIDAAYNDATLTWNVVGVETTWEIQYGLNGFTPGTGTYATVTNDTSMITGLTANSFYQAYVRGICGPGDTSFWTGPVTFNTYNQGLYMDWNTECPVSNFVDITSFGTNLNTTDDSEAGVTLPFSLLYQGTLVNNITVGNNGGIVLGTLTGAVGYTMVAGNGLYPYVQDMNTPYDGVYYATIGTAPNRQFIVQWSDLAHYFSSLTTDGVNFEVIIDEASQEIYYVYDDVIHTPGTASYDYGGDAEIGVRGSNQNINVSMNSQTYLQNNSCAHFFYTDCPAPKNFTISYVAPDEAAFSWTTGLAGETNWTIIYGPAGFDPMTPGASSITSTTPNAVLPSLTQLTCYDVYIYSDCNPSLQSSTGLFGTFCTPPFCSNPTAMINTVAVDSIMTSWSWTEFSPAYPSTSFNITYGMNGFDLYTEGTELALDNNTTDTIVNSALMAGGVYQLYVQAVCTNDTSSYIGPFTVIMPLANDTVCSAEMLAVDGPVYTFNNTGATVSTGETAIAPPTTGAQTTDGWINSVLNNTTWFTFVAPASGNIRINNTAINYAGQTAVYDALICNDFNTFTFLAGNDNAIGGTSNASNFTVCGLTPGNTYYIMHDGNTGTVGNYSINITSINLEAGSFVDVLDVCTGDTVNLFDGITGYQANGTWSAELASAGTGIYDSLFNSAGLAYQVFDFEYRLTDGCAYDSIVSQVQIFPPSSAGNDGSITVCRNEPVDLLSGLSGNVDTQGSWYDPSNALMPTSWIDASNIPGQFNYDYITGNGVCPNDTANVLLTVDGSCNYLNIEEMYFNDLTLYPNPTNGMIYISNEGSNESFNYSIMDVDGRVVATETSAINASSITEVNLTGKVTGVYLVRIYNSNAEKVYRVVLQ